MPTQPKAVEIFNQATWHGWPGRHRPSSHWLRILIEAFIRENDSKLKTTVNRL
jgi:hypothetical protein